MALVVVSGKCACCTGVQHARRLTTGLLLARSLMPVAAKLVQEKQEQQWHLQRLFWRTCMLGRICFHDDCREA